MELILSGGIFFSRTSIYAPQLQTIIMVLLNGPVERVLSESKKYALLKTETRAGGQGGKRAIAKEGKRRKSGLF